MIRPATTADAEAIAGIYNHYITDTVVTFEEEPVSAAEMARRLQDVKAASFPWLVAEEQGNVVGYAYAAPWKTRSAYRFSCEITVYLHKDHLGRGIGSSLYRDLFALVREREIHTIVGVIALPNEASVALHEKFGLEKVAHLKEVGFKSSRWIDVGYWQGAL